jgi:hypothetical protein
MAYLLRIKPARDGVHKYTAYFKMPDKKLKEVKFGASGMSDYTKHKDPKRMEAYLARHKTTENWNDPTTPGALSRWILWSSTSIIGGIRNYRNHFNM